MQKFIPCRAAGILGVLNPMTAPADFQLAKESYRSIHSQNNGIKDTLYGIGATWIFFTMGVLKLPFMPIATLFSH